MSKKYLFHFILSLSITTIAVSCKKGDSGIAGPQGPQGSQGVVGAAGADGSVIYSGTSTPAASIGKNGDYYLDLTSGILYGPKNASGWGNGFSMKGDDGAAGTPGAAGKAGTQVYSGTGAPATTLGVKGDFYMDTVAHNLYGPKLDAGWGIGVALQGPAGTANVQYTPWFTPTNWSGVNTSTQRYAYYDQPVPAITKYIAATGTVLVYGNLGEYSTDIWPTGTFGLLPLTVNYNVFVGFSTLYFENNWQAWVTAGNVRIRKSQTPANAILNVAAGDYFRVVIIPGGVSVPAGMSYKELKQYLHLNIQD